MTSRLLIGVFGLLITAATVVSASADTSRHRTTQELAAQSSRTRITIYPRREPGPNAKRYCRAKLVQEYRPSGTVIVPRMQCWWQ